MPGVVPSPSDRWDYFPDPFGVRALSWSVPFGAVGANVDLLLQDVADWPTLLFQNNGVGGAANAAVYSFDWFHDPQGSLIVTTDQVVVPPATPVDVALPCKAPYVRVTSRSITGAGSHPAGGRFRVTALPAASYAAQPQFIAGTNAVSVGASTTLTLTSGLIAMGRATFWASMPGNGTKWTASVSATDPSGNTAQLANLPANLSVRYEAVEFYVPPWPLSIQLQNLDTVAHGISSALIIGQ